MNLREILQYIPVHEAAQGFCRHRSTRSAAAVHVNQHVLLRVDLQDFFPNVPVARVAGIFCRLGYPLNVASLLTGLCVNKTWQGVIDEVAFTNERQDMMVWLAPLFQAHLPQRAPSAYSLDCRLAGLSKKFGGTYTRYADDLVFRGNSQFTASLSKFRVLILAIAID